MYMLISILIVVAALFLVFIVLVQNSKGGGLASGFASSNQVMGVRKTTDFLEKATWSLAGFIIVLSVVITAFTGVSKVVEDSGMREKIQNQNAVSIDPSTISPFENTAPVGDQQQTP